MTSIEARQFFADLASQPDRQIDLARAALVYALDEYPDLDIEKYLARLEMMQYAVWERVEHKEEPTAVLHTLNAYLFDERGFAGNREDYHDPRNSYLNEVMDRKLGLPITLSVIYLDIAQRLGLPVVGVGMPGHFLVKYHEEDLELFIDPFDGGKLMTEGECADRLNEVVGEEVEFHPHYLEPAGKKQTLSRMLANLRNAYLLREDFGRALQVTDKMLLLNPLDAETVRDVGLLHAQAGNFQQSLQYLSFYLRLAPAARDAGAIRLSITTLKEMLEHED